jgi:hypothetical protein
MAHVIRRLDIRLARFAMRLRKKVGSALVKLEDRNCYSCEAEDKSEDAQGNLEGRRRGSRVVGRSGFSRTWDSGCEVVHCRQDLYSVPYKRAR